MVGHGTKCRPRLQRHLAVDQARGSINSLVGPRDHLSVTDEPIWPLEAHTRAKHELLRRYLAAWFPVLTNRGFNRRVLFLDGFAGPGIYANGEPGSPIIALDTLVNHKHFPNLAHSEFDFHFVEPDRERFDSLEEQLRLFWARHPGGQPANVLKYTRDEFDGITDGVKLHLHTAARCV